MQGNTARFQNQHPTSGTLPARVNTRTTQYLALRETPPRSSFRSKVLLPDTAADSLRQTWFATLKQGKRTCSVPKSKYFFQKYLFAFYVRYRCTLVSIALTPRDKTPEVTVSTGTGGQYGYVQGFTIYTASIIVVARLSNKTDVILLNLYI